MELNDRYIIRPTLQFWSDVGGEEAAQGTPLREDFAFSSDCNTDWLDEAGLDAHVAGNRMSAAADGISRPVLPYGRPAIDDDDIAAVCAVLRSQWLTTGPAVEAFENALAAKVGARHAVACASGTAGLHLACLALGMGPGDGVIVPSITFAATANCARFVGAEVMFADVDPAHRADGGEAPGRGGTARGRAGRSPPRGVPGSLRRPACRSRCAPRRGGRSRSRYHRGCLPCPRGER